MDLQTFVQESLVQIAQGVEGANRALASSAARVNPPNLVVASREYPGCIGWIDPDAQPPVLVQEVRFDVAVRVSEGAGGSARAVITLGPFEVEGGGGRDSSSARVSRLSFSVPVKLPTSS